MDFCKSIRNVAKVMNIAKIINDFVLNNNLVQIIIAVYVPQSMNYSWNKL